ncbi:MAG: nucleoside hydrolase [Christensenellales bacterium]|jgi:inosine-uridine nucleoside N-ribohydrolase
MTISERLRLLSAPAGHIDMVLDTDAYNEIDDQFAISLAIRSKEKLTVKALCAAPFWNPRSVGPEDGMEKSYDEILKLLRLAGEDVPVYRGSKEYLPNEDTPVDSPAAREIARLAMEYSPEKPLYVVAIGAITNVASAILLNPAIAEKIVVVWLGGHAFEWHDNREFNCQQDVAAARVVFGCGCPLVILPCMGVVSAFTTTGPELEHWLKGKNPLAHYLQEMTIAEANSYAAGRPWSRPIWDATAVGWLLNEDDRFMLSRLEPTPIPEYDHYWGRDPRRPPCAYVYHIHRDTLFEELFTKIAR